MGIERSKLMKIKKLSTALISLSDKSSLEKLLSILDKYNIDIISSGGNF